MDNAEWKNASRATCEPMLKQQVRDLDPAPGVIAYLDGEAVGWCAVEPRPSYRRLDRMRILKGSPERPDDDSVWAVTCFVVRVGFRKRGVGRALLAGAVDHARRGGARVVEGYPVDPAQREKVSSAELPGGTTVVKSRSPPRPNVVAFEVPKWHAPQIGAEHRSASKRVRSSHSPDDPIHLFVGGVPLTSSAR